MLLTSASGARRTAAFAAYCLGVALIHVPVLRTLYDYSTQNQTASHVVVIPLVTVALVYFHRESIFAAVRTASHEGLAVILVGVGMAVTARLMRPSLNPDDALAMAVAAVVILWIGGFLLFYGLDAVRAAAFPLLFLGFTVPVPTPVLDAVIMLLRVGSTEAVGTLFSLTGTPYYREGFVFSLPSVVIEVAEECSGIRSSIALVLTTLLAGHVYLDRGWKKAVLVACTLPLTILKNGVRIVTLSLLAIHVDPEFLTGQLHHEGGFVFYLLTLVMLVPVFAWLRHTGGARVRTA